MNQGLRDPDTDNPLPIRHAEIRIVDSNKKLIQCGHTTVTGTYSLQVPRGSASLTLQVMARSNTSKVRVSVLDAPEFNTVYNLSGSFVPNQNRSLNLTAPAISDSSILAGAFNIYDQILNTNEYLRTQVSSQFVANKVSAYWKKGFDPGSYVGSPPVSFYYPGYSRMFILGGENGDVINSDTDHFDDAIIIHEYAHFLEDEYSLSDSPGGPHDGRRQIDARLAWSEGFANFFNAAVRTYVANSAAQANYVDSFGNSDGVSSTGIYIFADLESYEGCGGRNLCDRAEESGEAIFREFAISRFLYDLIDDTPDETDICNSQENGTGICSTPTWNANNNSPALSDSTGTEGDLYRVSTAGTRDLGSGSENFLVGDWVYYNGTNWIKNDNAAKIDTISGKFPQIWSALTASDGFKSVRTGFRDVGLLNLIHFVESAGDFSSLRDFHKLVNTTSPVRELRREYGYLVDNTSNGAINCGLGRNFSLTPKPDSNSYEDSNLLRNNDFFLLKHNGGPLSITLNYKTNSGTKANLDLYLYGKNGSFGYKKSTYNDGYIASSIKIPSASLSVVDSESFNLGSQPAGDYLINVYANAGQGGPTEFELRNANGKLCPKDVNL